MSQGSSLEELLGGSPREAPWVENLRKEVISSQKLIYNLQELLVSLGKTTKNQKLIDLLIEEVDGVSGALVLAFQKASIDMHSKSVVSDGKGAS